MGYLDNTSITVDAILTKKGRELLARNDGSFRITQFALGDDEIDYTLFNENHPNGTQYASEAIENMPLVEAYPDGTNALKSQLISLNRGYSLLPHITVTSGITDNTLTLVMGAEAASVTVTTANMGSVGTNAQESNGGYKFTVVNFNLLDSMYTPEDQGSPMELATYGGDEANTEIVVGSSLTIKPHNDSTLYEGDNTSLTTTLIIEGMETGARKSIQIVINKT